LGYVWTQLNLENNEGRLSMCGVKKEYRSKGIAKPLIISALNYLIKNNCELIYLEVDNENKPAKKIYKSLGFTKYSELNWFNIKY
jgi:ribosomal protein S18 acetylase RimI-like enzyme